jgi:hypothetical protein
MFLRKLTDEELEKIKKAKDKANIIIKSRRKKLMEEIKLNQNAFHIHQVEVLNKQLDELKAAIGHPMIIKVEDASLYLNYDLLNKFERSLDKSAFWNPDITIKEKSLIIQYQKFPNKGTVAGTVELFELPPYQVELLDGLPMMDLRDIEFEELLA